MRRFTLLLACTFAACGGKVQQSEVWDSAAVPNDDASLLDAVTESGDASTDSAGDLAEVIPPPSGYFTYCSGVPCRGQCGPSNIPGSPVECRCFFIEGGCPNNSVCCPGDNACVATCGWKENP